MHDLREHFEELRSVYLHATLATTLDKVPPTLEINQALTVNIRLLRHHLREGRREEVCK